MVCWVWVGLLLDIWLEVLLEDGGLLDIWLEVLLEDGGLLDMVGVILAWLELEC